MANFRKIGTDFTTGLRAPHYTNGRLLTAEDLQQEQQTNLGRQAQLGKAAGYGVVHGFEVTAAANSTALKINAGVGVNREGHVVQLVAGSVTLPIQPITQDSAPIRRAPRFEACDGDAADPAPTLSSGAYLLTASPVAQLEGAVPRKSCDGTATSTCANQWEVEGVEFKIIRLTNYKAPTGSRANRNRNLLAHWFYGSDKLGVLMKDPLQFDAAYTGFSRIAATDFNDCDVPLAVFFWRDNGIAFVDMWAVRRRITHPYPAAKWAANLSDQRRAEGEARFLQFQQQVADLQQQQGDNTDNLRAVDHFAFLPPVGILPVNPFELIVTDVFEQSILERQLGEIEERGLTTQAVLERVRSGVLSSLGSSNAYNLRRFFGDLLSANYLIVHEDFVHDRLHQSWVQAPIPLPPPLAATNFFQFELADGSLLAVNENNFNAVLGNISNNFSGTVFNVSTAASLASSTIAANVSPGAANVAATGVAATGAAPGAPAAANELANTAGGAGAAASGTGFAASSIAGRVGLLSHNWTFRPPKDIFIPPRDDDEETEPLVDIMVVDELLDPYRKQLQSEMVVRIDNAITALSSGGSIFTGINRFAAFNRSVANALALNTFLWQGANFGAVNFGNLLQLINAATPPIFYVVFARYRPPQSSRPLRL